MYLNIYYLFDKRCYLYPANGLWKVSDLHLTPLALLMFTRDHIKQVYFLSPWKSLGLGISTQDVSCIVIVVPPLNSLIQDQISGLKSSGLRPSAISINIRKKVFHKDRSHDTRQIK
jgi:hypothetical protein